MSQLLYLAHPIAGDVAGNLANVLLWKEWLQHWYPHLVASVPYYTDLLIYDDSDPEQRAAGIARDMVQLKRHDALVMLVRATPGVHNEACAMQGLRRPVYDLRHLGEKPPEGAVPADEWKRWRF